MSSAYRKLFSLPDRRPFLLSLILAVVVCACWQGLSCLQVRIGASEESLRVGIDYLQWSWRWPWFSGSVMILGLAAVALRGFWSPAAAAGKLHQHLRKLIYICAGLCVLRLLSLWDLFGLLFPFLSLLWSPHCSWALSLLFLVTPLLEFGKETAKLLGNIGNRFIALIFFAVCGIGYSAYALYFCQVTMIHGDEGQYLLIAQSLIRDGDMDMGNNLTPENILEFHILDDFDVHAAPASPPEKMHSVHPIGLSVLLVPAYWLGLELWQNPRLASALLIALISAACVALIFVWQVRIQLPRWAAILSTAVVASTGPFFLYTNQLYPEVPALLITLVALVSLSHWQVGGARYCDWGRWEPVLLALLTLALSALPFLHPRFTSVALLAAIPLALQIRCSPRRRPSLLAVAVVASLSIGVLIRFNFAFSNDWLGHFRPGNAWEAGALDPLVWLISLPGQWLHADVGLANTSPIYLLSWAGLALLFARRDRRLLVVLGLYGATAAVNGLHTDWKFGYCFPSRFIITALPALAFALGLAATVAVRHIAVMFAAFVFLRISFGSVQASLALPEVAYKGVNHLGRAINYYYPWQSHFIPADRSDLAVVEPIFWLLLVAVVLVIPLIWQSERRQLKYGLLFAATLLPLVWGRAEQMAKILETATSRIGWKLAADGSFGGRRQAGYSLSYKPLAASPREDGRFVLRGGEDPPGLAARAYMPTLHPGIYALTLPDLTVSQGREFAPGHLFLSQRYMVLAKSIWETRLSMPLRPSPGSQRLLFHSRWPVLGFAHIVYSGVGDMAFQELQLISTNQTYEPPRQVVHRFPVSQGADRLGPLAAAAKFPARAAGKYSIRFELAGFVLPAFFARDSSPAIMAVFLTPVGKGSDFQERMSRWFSEKRDLSSVSRDGPTIQPAVESIQPSWWLAIPGRGERQFELDFAVHEPRDAWFLIKYKGPQDLAVDGMVLYRHESGVH